MGPDLTLVTVVWQNAGHHRIVAWQCSLFSIHVQTQQFYIFVPGRCPGAPAPKVRRAGSCDRSTAMGAHVQHALKLQFRQYPAIYTNYS